MRQACHIAEDELARRQDFVRHESADVVFSIHHARAEGLDGDGNEASSVR